VDRLGASHTTLPDTAEARAFRLKRFILVGLLIALAVWFPFAGVVLIDSEPPAQADAIVVLGGSATGRLPWAEQLRGEGYADLLIVSNEQVHTHGLETTWLGLHRAGIAAPEIPDASLLVIDDPVATSTLEEARRSADLLQARGLHSALGVTDAFHSRRAALLFRAIFARRGLQVRSVPAPDSFDLAHWWTHPLSARRVLEEWVKLVYYLALGAYW
jgi:uncharacterized SAM-binding protein YcdF (DUF218 family)